MHALQRIRHRHAAGSLLGWSLRLGGGTTVAADCGPVYAWSHRVRCCPTVPARASSWGTVRIRSCEANPGCRSERKACSPLRHWPAVRLWEWEVPRQESGCEGLGVFVAADTTGALRACPAVARSVAVAGRCP